MIEVLIGSILPIFAIIAVGFFMGRTRHASLEQAQTINRFVMTVLIPILMVAILVETPISRFPLKAVLIYAGAQLLLMTVGYWLARKIFNREPGEAILLALCAVFGNSFYYVLPIARLIYPDDPLLPMAVVILSEIILVFLVAMPALELLATSKSTPMAAFSRLAQSPVLWSIALGLALSLAEVQLPNPIQTFLDFNGAAAAPAALWALGVVLSTTSLQPDKAVILFATIKMFAFPLTVALGLTIFLPNQANHQLYHLAAAAPAGIMGFSLAMLYNIQTKAICQIILITSILTLFTLAALA